MAMHNPPRYILFHKPYGVLSQFTREAGHLSLRDFGPFPKGVYPAGRLDVDSEGLLLLTDDNDLTHRLTTPSYGHERTYLVQVERVPPPDALEQLRHGVTLRGRTTLPAKVELLRGEPALSPRAVPVRMRKTVPTCWLQITLTEGRNRQVRKMTAAIGHPALRLVRTRIATLALSTLRPGEGRTLTASEVRRLRALLYSGASGGSGRRGGSGGTGDLGGAGARGSPSR